MNDVEDLLAAGALSGQDRPRGENLDGAEEGGINARFIRGTFKVGGGVSGVTMEPMDCTADGTGVADRPGWVLLGAGLTVALDFGTWTAEERGLLSDRSTGSV